MKKLVLMAALLGGAVLLTAAGVWGWRALRRPEPPPERKIRREFRAAFDPEESTLMRLADLRLRFRAEPDIPREERHRLIVEALAESVNRQFAAFAKLPPDRKPEQAERMREDAELTFGFFRSFPPEKRRKALALLADTPGGRAQIDRAIAITAGELSPEDRVMLGPTIKIWKNMLEGGR